MNNALVDALDNAITLIQEGKSPDEILELYPQWKDDLRPLLDTVLAARSLRVDTPTSNAAQARSRAQFLTLALRQPNKRPFLANFLHFRTAMAAGLALSVVLLIGTGFASAKSMPGDILYPVKIASEQTRLLFVTDPVQRLELQLAYDSERVDEVEALVEHSRSSEITFSGNLVRVNDHLWQVAKVDLIFTPQLELQARNLTNRYVEIHGVLQSSGALLVERLQLRQLDFSGTLQGIADDEWTISHIRVKIDDQTLFRGDISLGSTLQVKAIRHEDGSLMAVEIEGPPSNKPDQQQVAPTETATESEEQPQKQEEARPTLTTTPEPGSTIEPEVKPTSHPENEDGEPAQEDTWKKPEPSPTRAPSQVGQGDHEGETKPEKTESHTSERSRETEKPHDSEPTQRQRRP
jgi:hypothetical protein